MPLNTPQYPLRPIYYYHFPEVSFYCQSRQSQLSKYAISTIAAAIETYLKFMTLHINNEATACMAENVSSKKLKIIAKNDFKALTALLFFDKIVGITKNSKR